MNEKVHPYVAAAHEEPQWRPVRTLVSFPVMSLVGLRRSGSSGSQQNTFSNSGRLDLLHPEVVDLAPPYSQHHANALRYTSTFNYNSRLVPVSRVPVGSPYRPVLLNSGKQTKTQSWLVNQRCPVRARGRLTVTHWLVGYLSAPVTGATKRLPEVRAQPLINPRNMTHTVMYDRMRPLPDIRYDVMCQATTTGNVSPVIAFLSRNCHTAVITGPYSVPEGPWVPVYPFFPVERAWA